MSIALDQVSGERVLERPLLDFLHSLRKVRQDSIIVHELPWNGRRVDIATLTATGITSAYELKLANHSRVVEQAFYNSMSFDLSWVVVDRDLSRANFDSCAAAGIGIITVDERVRVSLPALRRSIRPEIRKKLSAKITSKGI